MTKDEADHLLIKIASSEILNGGYQKLNYRLDLMSEDLAELKTDYKIQTQSIQNNLKSHDEDIREIKEDIKQIKESLPSIQIHVKNMQDIGGGENLLLIRDSVRSFTWTKGILLSVLGSGIIGAIIKLL